jgi:hypothetical protein
LQSINPPTLFPHSSRLLRVPTASGKTCFAILFSDFVKEKKWHFCFFMIVTQRVSLWHIHAYMYYNPDWFIPSIFLISTLIFFLWWFQQV